MILISRRSHHLHLGRDPPEPANSQIAILGGLPQWASWTASSNHLRFGGSCVQVRFDRFGFGTVTEEICRLYAPTIIGCSFPLFYTCSNLKFTLIIYFPVQTTSKITTISLVFSGLQNSWPSSWSCCNSSSLLDSPSLSLRNGIMKAHPKTQLSALVDDVFLEVGEYFHGMGKNAPIFACRWWNIHDLYHDLLWFIPL